SRFVRPKSIKPFDQAESINMFKSQQLTRTIAFIAAAILLMSISVSFSDEFKTPPSESVLIEILKTKETPEKAIACKQLAIRGTKECVPELAKLLSDKE